MVVFKVDRIARRLREGLDLLCDWCERGVRVVAVTQQVDVSGTMGRMVAALMLGLAEIEWEYRRIARPPASPSPGGTGSTGRVRGPRKRSPTGPRNSRPRG